MRRVKVNSKERIEFIDITQLIQKEISDAKWQDGILTLYVPHTTAALTINEGADPDVTSDIIRKTKELVPHSGNYSHLEGNSDAHIKSTLIGVSETIIVEGGKLCLGTWQSVFFCEFDGPRSRSVYMKFINQKS